MEALVALTGVAEVGLAVEVDVAEDIVKFGLVGVFQRLEENIDDLTDVRAVAAFVLRWKERGEKDK